MLIVVWSLIEATTNQLARMLMWSITVWPDGEGFYVGHTYLPINKVLVYQKNMGKQFGVCGGIWLASCRRSVCACVGGSSSSQSRAWFGWEAELTGWYFQKNKIKEWTGWKLIE